MFIIYFSLLDCQHLKGSSFSKCLCHLFILFFGCVGSLLLRVGFLYLRWVGGALCRGAWASHCSGFACCGSLFCRTFLCVSIFPKCAREMVLSLRFQQLCVKHACLQWGLSLVLLTSYLSFYFSCRGNSLHYSHSWTSHSGVWQLWPLRSFENAQQGWCPEPNCEEAVDPEVTNVPCPYCCLPFGWYLGQYLQMESERAEQLILFLNKKWIKL